MEEAKVGKTRQKVAILMGGPSSEAEISRTSARTVAAALEDQGMDHQLIELDETWMDAVKAYAPTFVFLGLHGVPGEDGTVQGALELMGYPYQGSGVLASALAMDKGKARVQFEYAGLSVAKGWTIADATAAVPSDLTFPVVVKPAQGGSTLGLTILENADGWQEALACALKFGQDALVESFVAGEEYTVALLHDEVLGGIHIQPQVDGHYSYEAKYKANNTQYTFVEEDTPLYARLAKDAAIAVKSLGVCGMSRVDFIYDEKADELVVLEVNTLPGLNVLYPRMLKRCGRDFAETICQLIEEGGTPAHDQSALDAA